MSFRRFGFALLSALCLLVAARSLQQHWDMRYTTDVPLPSTPLVTRELVPETLGEALSRAAAAWLPSELDASSDAAPVPAPAPAPASQSASPPPPVGPRYAVVSLMMPAQGKNESKYTDCLLFMIHTLKASGWPHDVLVLATHDAREADVARVLERGIAVKRVTNIAATSSTDPSMLSMFTKLHAWNLTQYDQVAFYDSDHVFLRSPAAAFTECGDAPFCATGDTGIRDFYHRPDLINEHTYFNAGFMMLRPNVTTLEWLMSQRQLGEGTAFVDQDMLNAVYKGKWKALDERYNRMHTYRRGLTNDTVAVHEKFWILRQHFPEPTWSWNSGPLPRRAAA